ncbi:Pre-mRNA-splicing factor Cwf15/Cwc15 [Cladorrhinum sp. PSN332]|nr:Pre-mRNA-splicing factor Cwf15/Cwc15 [Cladorrhinum sp. PSN332]
MTTAHRPTFDPARGKEALRGPAYHQRLLPAYTQLKFRQPGQGGDGDDNYSSRRDLRAELEAAEQAHFAKVKGIPLPSDSEPNNSNSSSSKRPLQIDSGNPDNNDEEEDQEAKRRRILQETRDIDADSSGPDGSSSDSENDSDDDDSDSDDEDAELQRELERVRRERAEKREREEKERLAAEQEEKEKDIALGNPLLNKQQPTDFGVKRRWDDDVVFKNQARGTEEKGKRKEFINDLLRSDFHKRFMSKYVR